MCRRLRRFLAGPFQRQLLAFATVGLIGLASAIVFVTNGFLGWRLESLGLLYFGELSELFANESAVVFLAGSDEAARERVGRIAAFPGVRQAALFKPDRRIWVSSAADGSWPPPPSSGPADTAGGAAAAPYHDDGDGWSFIAPVRLGKDADTPTAALEPPQLLGYVGVVWRKSPLAQLRQAVFALSGLITLGLTVAAILALRRLLRRLTEPLNQLAHVMRSLKAGTADVRAAVAGPEETRDIGLAFNALLDQLDQHRQSLENRRADLAVQVAERTRELHLALDAALTAKRHKDAFLSTMTHEMRTPLNSIIGYMQLCTQELKFARDDLDRETFENLSEGLNTALASAAELKTQVDEVLQLARIEAGKRSVKLENVDLAALLDQVITAVKPLAERNGNRLVFSADTLPSIVMDEEKLRQMTRNLLDNACKFTRDGTVILAASHAPDKLTVEVVDTGAGIDEDQRDRIFEPFHQADLRQTPGQGGIGLGLAIVKSHCDLLGATLVLDSAPGRGSRFEIHIPLPVLARANDAPAERERPASAAR